MSAILTGGRLKYLIYTETFPSRNPASQRQTGIGRYCYDLAFGLTALRQEVSVLTNTAIGPAERDGPEPFPVVATGEEPRSFLELLLRRALLADLCASKRPDVLLVGDPAAHRVCAQPGLRIPRHYLPIFYGSELLAMERELRRSSVSPARILRGAITRHYLAHAPESICISQYTARVLHRIAPSLRADCIVYPSVSELVLRWPTNVDQAQELRRRLVGGNPSVLVLLTVARISERKNQLGVLEALAHLHQTTEARFHYVIVGNVDSDRHADYFARLQAFARANRLDRSVTFVSSASEQEKIRYLDACDVFAMLSRTVETSVEGFGISAIEASCRGKPVVVSDQGGMPETIIEGRTGFAVPPEDPRQIAGALLSLAQDIQLRRSMGEAGREFARREFTPEASARRLHQHLVSGINRPGR